MITVFVNRWSAGGKGSLVAVLALCCGCMTMTSRMHVDKIAAWHDVHAEALPAFLATVEDKHVATFRRHIQSRLTTRRIGMENDLRQIALERMAACGTTLDQTSGSREIACLRRRIADAEADSLSRIANLPNVYRLIHELSSTQERLWIGVVRQRADCSKSVQDSLHHALGELDTNYQEALRLAKGQVSELPEKWSACKSEAREKLERVRWYIDELEKCKSPWHGDCNDPNEPPRLGDSPLLKCRAGFLEVSRIVDNAISGGEEQLARHYRKAVEDVRESGPEVAAALGISKSDPAKDCPTLIHRGDPEKESTAITPIPPALPTED